MLDLIIFYEISMIRTHGLEFYNLSLEMVSRYLELSPLFLVELEMMIANNNYIDRCR